MGRLALWPVCRDDTWGIAGRVRAGSPGPGRLASCGPSGRAAGTVAARRTGSLFAGGRPTVVGAAPCAGVRDGQPRRIRVNIVMPGLIDTPLGRLATLVKPDRADTPIPLGRQGTAWEVANSVIFLLSDQAAYITGQTLVIDGGLSGLC